MGPVVHFELTRLWAEQAGLGDIAERIARANVGVDWDRPARGSIGNMSLHFAPTAHLWAARYLSRALRERSPAYLGCALHCAQDAVAHGVLGMGHLRYMAGLARNPDDWDGAPERVRTTIERRSMKMLRRYAAGTGPISSD
ncbi:MAG: hypothetical protein ACYC77_02210 [Coriobacteriia bacterium]